MPVTILIFLDLKVLFDATFDPVENFKPPIVKRKMPALTGAAAFMMEVRPMKMPFSFFALFIKLPAPLSFLFVQFEQAVPPPKVMQETPKQRQKRIRTSKMASEDELMEMRFTDCRLFYF